MYQYAASRNVAADHTRHDASRTRKRHWPSEIEGAQRTPKGASESTKDATTLSSSAEIGAANITQTVLAERRALSFGTVLSFYKWDHEYRILNLALGQPSHIT